MQSNPETPLPSNTPVNAQASYQLRIAYLDSQIRMRSQLMQRLVWLRLGFSLPGLALIVFGLAQRGDFGWAWKLGILMMVIFLAAATWHETNLWITSQLRQRLYGYRRLLARCHREWSELLPLPTEECCATFQSDLTRDLDVFGDRSLYRWCSLAMTQSGAKTLCRWLTQWTDSQTVRERQSAVAELAGNRSWREAFFETTCEYRNQQASPEGLVQWSQTESFFGKSKWVHWLTVVGPAVIVAGIGIIVASKVQDVDVWQWIGLACVLGGVALNFILTISVIGPIHDIFVKIGTANRELQSLVNIILAIRRLDSKQPLLQSVQRKCFDENHSAENALAQLQRIMALAGMQRSPLLFIPYLILQIVFLWDVRVLELLESWKSKFGSNTGGWLEAIGMVETLCSAAAIADEYPAWAYPQCTEKDSGATNLLMVRGVSHPLLKDTNQVPNSVTIRRDKPLLLVTGSNMAGKSTLLRSIGINSLLARLGAPVCATAWTGAVCELASSIRVQDSLQDGVSFFMAELKRLRGVVDQAQKENQPEGRQMLVLLDEILQGTNSRERQIAVEHVLDKLVACGCIVLTSTHDLEMAGNQSIHRIAQVVHFREHFETVDGQQVMRFDYIMRDGVTPTTNALKLLEMVGLK